MMARQFQFSMRSLLWLIACIACIMAFLCAFGRHLLWLPTHAISPNHASLIELTPSPTETDESFVCCQFGGIRFELPESMTKQLSVHRDTRGSNVYLKFTDETRAFTVQFPRNFKKKPHALRTTLLPLPKGMDDWTYPRLLKAICSSSSDSFSWRQSKGDLLRHRWSATHRRGEFNMELNNFEFFRFQSDPSFEWILISCDSATIDGRERVRGLLSWETQDLAISGTLYFGDSAQHEVTWIDTVASSFQTTLGLPANDLASSIAKKTDAEILSMLDMNHDPAEHGRDAK